MPSQKNKVLVAAAGSGKTTSIVESAVRAENPVAVVTFTINNEREIKRKFYELNGHIPAHVTIITWFRFLLAHWIRPYRLSRFDRRVEGIIFVEGRSALRVPRFRNSYFFGSDDRIYTDKIAEYALMCNNESGGLVLDRLSELYRHIFIDEVQDLAGYDLELLEALRDSSMKLTLVGDPRQATYKTNHSPKNSQYGGAEIVDRFEEWEKDGHCEILYRTSSHRCNQQICDFANLIYPQAPKTISTQYKTQEQVSHQGVFLVSKCDIEEYIATFDPARLRDSKRSNTSGYSAMNFGESKGLTFPRVLIFPTGPLKNVLKSGDFNQLKKTSAAKVYVAVTRARHSVAILYDGKCGISGIKRWKG